MHDPWLNSRSGKIKKLFKYGLHVSCGFISSFLSNINYSGVMWPFSQDKDAKVFNILCEVWQCPKGTLKGYGLKKNQYMYVDRESYQTSWQNVNNWWI